MRTLAERLRADLPGLDDEEINELQDYLTRTRLGSVTDIDLDRYQCLPWGSEDIDEIGRRICGAAVFEGLDRLDDFEISRVMFLTRVAGKHPPGTPVSVTGDGCCAFSMYSDRACYRAGQGDPVPGVDLVPDPLAMLTDGARRRLREVEDANPGVDIEALFIEAVSSRTGKVGVDLCYLGSPKAGTRQLEYIAKEIWHRFRTGTKR